MSDANDRRTGQGHYDEVSHRLGVVEATNTRLSEDVRIVRERTHDHGQLLHILDDKLEERAIVQRNILTNLTHLGERVEKITQDLAVNSATTLFHVQMCDKRAARVEKFMWFLATCVVTILGFLLAPHFTPH